MRLIDTDPIVIVAAKRTPMGGLLGDLSSLTAPELGARAIEGAMAQSGLGAGDVDQIFFGNVLSAGQGQAPARQAARKAGLDDRTEATTLNKMCGSGMQALIMARAALACGESRVIIAGGMESMSQAPHLMARHRGGVKYGHDQILDHMALDGLEDADERKPMGFYADQIANEYQFTREAQDEYALSTLSRAKEATNSGTFMREIVAVTVGGRSGDVLVANDELPAKARPEKIPQLRPAFTKDGTVTAANASAISDGAAALIVMRQSEAEKRAIAPLAKIVATAAHAHAPAYFTTAPVPAMRKVLERAGWGVGDVDLFEINEAFAVVPMVAIRDLSIPRDMVNVHGGACALGHPIGASGARIVATLINALQTHHQKRGVASLCIGGGEATALALELC
jgi:acetyl-CoA C-acetyltransferase